MNLEFDEAIENHRKMWNWIADETEKRKEVVNKSVYFEENEINRCKFYCFCCQYAIDNGYITKYGSKRRDCRLCPIDWGVELGNYEKHQCSEFNTPYDWWCDAYDLNDWKSSAKYAKEIANLPEMKEIKMKFMEG